MAPLAIAAVMAYGKYQEGQSEAANLKSQANMEKYNAAVERNTADQVERTTAFKQNRQAEAGARQQSTMINDMGGSGAEPSLSVLAKQASESELENLMIGYEGGIESQQHLSAAGLHDMQGKIYKKKAKNVSDMSYLNAGTSLLAGFSPKSGGNLPGGRAGSLPQVGTVTPRAGATLARY